MSRAALGLIGWMVLSLLAGAVGGVATSQEAPAFYQTLQRPAWSPPAWVFGPVWTVLYVTMGIAAWLVWKPAGLRGAKRPLSFFLVQLALNAAWSWIFFGWRQIGWALVEIVVLWLAILATVVAFWRARPLAGALLLPYLGWVGFAVALNGAIWWSNRPGEAPAVEAHLVACPPATRSR